MERWRYGRMDGKVDGRMDGTLNPREGAVVASVKTPFYCLLLLASAWRAKR